MNSDDSQISRTRIIVRVAIAIAAITGTVLAFQYADAAGIFALLACIWLLMVISGTHTPVEAGCVIVIIIVLTAIGLGIIHLFRA